MITNPPLLKKFILPAVVFFVLLVISLAYWKGYGRPDTGIDDANIYFVYMKNFAQGHGLVWNAGGERVEGFSSFLWTMLGALFYKLSPAHFTLLLFISCALLCYATIYTVILFSRKLNNTQEKTLAAADLIILFLLIAPRGFIEWNLLSLMETALWTFLLVSTTLLLCNYYYRDRKINLIRFSAMLVLINLTRPESITFNPVFIAVLFVMLYADYGRKYALRKTLIPFAVHVVSLGSLIVWRKAYFGYPLPNTYYAKVSGSIKNNLTGGAGYLYSFFSNYPYAAFLLPLFFFAALAMLLKWKERPAGGVHESIQAVLLAVIFSGLAFPVLTGGDHFGFSRFYQPLLPLVCLAAVHYFFWRHYIGITIASNKTAAAAVTLAVVFAAFFSGKSTLPGFFRNEPLNFPEFIIAKNGRRAAAELNRAFADCKQYPSIGATAAGGFGFAYNGKTIDMLGLNNTVMAHANSIKTGVRSHASFDKNGFWKLRPDIAGTVFGGETVTDTASFVLYENQADFRTPGSAANFMYELYKGLFDDENFRQTYLPALVKNKHLDYFVFGYYHKDFLRSLDASVYSTTLVERKTDTHQAALKK